MSSAKQRDILEMAQLQQEALDQKSDTLAYHLRRSETRIHVDE